MDNYDEQLMIVNIVEKRTIRTVLTREQYRDMTADLNAGGRLPDMYVSKLAKKETSYVLSCHGEID